MKLSVSSNIKQFSRQMTKAQKSQLPFATARALTWTAQDAKLDVEKRIDAAFDRPTPYTRKGVAAISASKRKQVSRVLIKDRQAEYLGLQEDGGTRKPKGRALVIPQDKTNKYGNMPRGYIRRVLARGDTFSGTVRGVAGIWQRTRSGSVKLLVAYEQKAQYRPRFQFERTAERTARTRFPINFERSFRQAMQTAR